MCLLIIGHRADPRFPLVVAANRDEFHARATAVSGFWPDHPELLAGRDLEQGGTWMGVTKNGRFAAITNYRDPARTAPAPRSRGELPLDYLRGDLGPASYLREVSTRADDYAGFNLLVADREELWYFTNSQAVGIRRPQCLPAGIYGLSNANLDTPWPKVRLGKASLESLLEQEPPRHDTLARVVSDRRPADVQGLQLQGSTTGMDQLLSAQFIVTASYGTRSTTTLWTDSSGRVHWRELSFDDKGKVKTVCEEEFDVS